MANKAVHWGGADGDYMQFGAWGADHLFINGISIELWLYVATADVKVGRQDLASPNFSDSRVGLFLDGARPRFSLFSDGIKSAIASTDITLDGWNHIVGTFQPIGDNTNLYIYLNGVQTVGDSAWEVVSDGATLIRYAGQASGLTNTGLHGSIDELRFWNKGLSQAEVSVLYNSGDGLYLPTDLTNLVAGYHFDDDLVDYSGNGLDGVMGGDTSYIDGHVVPSVTSLGQINKSEILGYDREYNFSITENLSNTDYRTLDICAIDSTHVWRSVTDDMTNLLGYLDIYNGEGWVRHTTLPSQHYVYGISAVDANHVWAAVHAEVPTGHGDVYFFDGEDWTVSYTINTYHMRDVCALDANHVWAVGDNGTIVFWDGNTWTPQVSGTTNALWCICAVDATHVWVGGLNKILFFDGNTWTTQLTDLDMQFENIEAADATHVWVSSPTFTDKTLLFFDGNTWANISADLPASEYDYPGDVNGIYVYSPTSVFVAHLINGISYFNGLTWEKQAAPRDYPPNQEWYVQYDAIDGVDDEGVWFGGRAGATVLGEFVSEVPIRFAYWMDIDSAQIQIGGVWKDISEFQIQVNGAWKDMV
jgi:hypothetical protein